MSAAPPGRSTSRTTPRPEPRWKRRIRRGDKLVCPRGHPLPVGAQHIREGPFKCEHIMGNTRDHGTVCGCWFYLAGKAGFGTFVAAIDFPEVAAVELCETPDEVWTLLGIEWD